MPGPRRSPSAGRSSAISPATPRPRSARRCASASRCRTTSAFPYAAVGFSDFWRRWHITLSSWLRDYLYIPLGGNRHGPRRTYAALMTTMLLGGLWHGANWTFVAWGGLHGLYLSVERALRQRFSNYRPGPLVFVALGLLTYTLVNVTWVFFRAKTFGKAWSVLRGMAGQNAGAAPILPTFTLTCVGLIVGGILMTHWLMRSRTLESVVARTPAMVVAVVWALMGFAISSPRETEVPSSTSSSDAVRRPVRPADRSRPARCRAAGAAAAGAGAAVGAHPARGAGAGGVAAGRLGSVLARLRRDSEHPQHARPVGDPAPAHRCRRGRRHGAAGSLAHCTSTWSCRCGSAWRARRPIQLSFRGNFPADGGRGSGRGSELHRARC